ncbi:zinc knuckle CX2CX4HX4C containing protein [Tanacetum coccineum]|uniref:Zinc knuckle CX2CX4HX4C containing protein n=1 Tax=Tanacetum coccineum TaxID=301880 RepID=A0ABQ4XUL0_9ASTR
MSELREDTFSGYKNDDAHEHVEKVLYIVGLFNIPGELLMTWLCYTNSVSHAGVAKRRNDTTGLGGQAVVGFEIYEGAHLEKEYPLKKEVKRVKEVEYGEFRRSFPNNGGSEARRQENRKKHKRKKWSGKYKKWKKLMKQCRPAHHTEEALVSRTIESLREIRVNLPLIKEIRKTDDYARHMKNLVVTKTKTLEEGDVKPNVRCLWKLKPVSMTVEMADRTKSIPKGIVENLLVKNDKFIFPIDFVILDMVEDVRMTIILGRPLLATANAKIDIFRKLISLELGNEKVVFKIEYNFNETLTPIESESQEEIDYRCSMLDKAEP